MAKYSRETLLNLLRKAVTTGEPGLKYGVGGATAMAEHGYKRFTQDVDVFVLQDGLSPLMARLRDVGLQIFAIQEPSHYAAKIPGDPEPERRIDVLVSYGEPEMSAIEYATVGTGGLRFFGADLLAMAKFYAHDDSGDVRHALDMAAMHRRGLFSAERVRQMIELIDPERLKKYDEVVKSFEVVSNPKPRPTKRLPPPKKK